MGNPRSFQCKNILFDSSYRARSQIEFTSPHGPHLHMEGLGFHVYSIKDYEEFSFGRRSGLEIDQFLLVSP